MEIGINTPLRAVLGTLPNNDLRSRFGPVPTAKLNAVLARLTTAEGWLFFLSRLVVYVLCPLAVFSTMSVADADLWGHLKAGFQMLEGRGIPQVNLYSWTDLGGRWIDHEWLSQLLFAAAYIKLGNIGLILVKGTIYAGFLFLYSRVVEFARPSRLGHCVLFLSGAGAVGSYFFFRPQIFTYLFLTIELLIVFRFLVSQTRDIYFLPFLFVLWANLHGGFVLGIGVLGMTSLAQAIQVFRKARSHKPKSIPIVLSMVTITSVAATLVNPYGLDLWFSIYRNLSSPLVHRYVNEWKAFHATLDDVSLLYLALIFLATWAYVTARKSKSLLMFWFVSLAIIMPLSSVRHLPIAWILAAYPIAKFLPLRVSQVPGGNGVLPQHASWVAIGFGLVTLAMASFVWQRRQWLGNIVFSSADYPVGATRFMRENHMDGRLWNPYDHGLYLVWHLYPDMLVSMDGRYPTVYSDREFRENVYFYHGKQGPSLTLDRHPADFALLPSSHPFASWLERGGLWSIIYRDPQFVLFSRRPFDQSKGRTNDPGTAEATFP